MIAVFLFAQIHDDAGERFAAGSAFCPYLRQGHRMSVFLAPVLQRFDFCLRIADKFVDGDHIRKAEGAHRFDVLSQVGTAIQHRLYIFLFQVFEFHAAMLLQRTDGRNDDDRIGMKIRKAAFDVQELLRTQICAKSGFRHRVICQLQTRLRRQHRVAAMRDIGKRSAMHDDRIMLQRLDQVRLDGVLHDHGQRPFDVQITHIDRFALRVVCDEHVRKTRLEIFQRSSQAQHGHDL